MFIKTLKTKLQAPGQWGIVFLLGFSSGLPLALLGSTLQAWFASSGVSLTTTGLLSLIGLPYVYRILWAPLVDKYSLFPLGKRRSWMLTMQIGLMIGFNIMAWYSPDTSPGLMAALALFLACLSATQDVTIDAQRVEYLPQAYHALGASLAVLGYRLAMLVSGGVALIFADEMGWSWTYRAMGGCMSVGILATLLSREPSIESTLTLSQSFIEPVKELSKRPGIIYLVLFILMFKWGEAFTSTISGIVMPFLIQGMGFSLSTVGYINKMLGVGAVLMGGFVAGILLVRWSMARALMVFGVFQALSNGLFVILAMVGTSVPLLAVAVSVDNFATGMGATAIVALFMRLVNPTFTATQFSILVAIGSLPRIFSGPIAAWTVNQIGWIGLYEFVFVSSFLFIPILRRVELGTEGRTRTDTVSPPPDFESGASTNSTTPARVSIITKK